MIFPLLSECGENVFSQFGEDGMIQHLLDRIGIKHHRCGEVGAADGLFLSNTAHLWRHHGWLAVLAERGPEWEEKLLSNVDGFDVEVWMGPVTPDNINDIFHGDFDVLSIDVDGDDYFLFEALTGAPRIVVIEINHSIPWWMNVKPSAPSGRLGSSASAMVELAAAKGYVLVGATGCNLFFVHHAEFIDHRLSFESGLSVLMEDQPVTYMATDYSGNRVLLGANPPWGDTYTDSPEEFIVREQP